MAANEQKKTITNLQKANNVPVVCTRKWTSRDYQTRNLKRPLCLSNTSRYSYMLKSV